MHEFPLVWFLVAFVSYTSLLFLVSHLTSRGAGSGSFFSGDRKAPWPVVAYGMVGASISGVSFKKRCKKFQGAAQDRLQKQADCRISAIHRR